MSSQRQTCTRLPDNSLVYTTLTRALPPVSAENMYAYKSTYGSVGGVGGVGGGAGGCPSCVATPLGIPTPYELIQRSQESQLRPEVVVSQSLSLENAVNLGLIPVRETTFKAYPYQYATTVTDPSSGFPVKLSHVLQCGNTSTRYY